MSLKRGIIVAGGKATRLHPATLTFGKQLLPIYDKPMIYYPLSTLLLAGVREVLIITSPRDKKLFEDLLGDGSRYGISISYIAQPHANGIAGALLLGRDFIGDDNVCLILGDNFFYGPGMDAILSTAANDITGATIFCHHVADPSSYGVARLNHNGVVTELVEKPKHYISNWAVTGLYFYDRTVCALADTLAPSARGELEITDLNIRYLEQKKLRAVTLNTEFTWFDLGTHQSIHEAAEFIRSTEHRYGIKIGCLEEAAWKMGLITTEQLLENARSIENTEYAEYIKALSPLLQQQQHS